MLYFPDNTSAGAVDTTDVSPPALPGAFELRASGRARAGEFGGQSCVGLHERDVGMQAAAAGDRDQPREYVRRYGFAGDPLGSDFGDGGLDIARHLGARHFVGGLDRIDDQGPAFQSERPL